MFAPGHQAALVVWDVETANVQLVNEELAEIVQWPVGSLIGRDLRDTLDPDDGHDLSWAALRSGALDKLTAQRRVLHSDGTVTEVSVATRVVDVGGRRLCVTFARRSSDVVQPPVDSGVWVATPPIVVGVVDLSWRMIAIGADTDAMFGSRPGATGGEFFLDLVHPSDWPAVFSCVARAGTRVEVRLRHAAGGWVDASMLVAPSCEGIGRMFALVGRPIPHTNARLAELELHLRRIAAEVSGSGVLDATRDAADECLPQLQSLSARQREVLDLVLAGARVPTIAAELFISESTVRNHLSAIFQCFGVHSQDALIRLLRGPLTRQNN